MAQDHDHEQLADHVLEEAEVQDCAEADYRKNSRQGTLSRTLEHFGRVYHSGAGRTWQTE